MVTPLFVAVQSNTISSSSATSFGNTIGGGDSNSITGASLNGQADHCVIAGGFTNAISAAAGDTSSYSTISGGANNSIGGATAVLGGTIPGGQNNTILGGANNSMASGQSATVGINHINTYVWADGNATTSTNTNQYVIRAQGAGIGTDSMIVYSAAGIGTGVHLASGGTAWASISGRQWKENIVELDPLDTLRRVESLPIYQFNYVGNDSGLVCRGPISDEWHSQFPSAKNPNTIDTQDLTGVSLASIRGLAKLVKSQAATINQMRSEISALRQQIESATLVPA